MLHGMDSVQEASRQVLARAGCLSRTPSFFPLVPISVQSSDFNTPTPFNPVFPLTEPSIARYTFKQCFKVILVILDKNYPRWHILAKANAENSTAGVGLFGVEEFTGYGLCEELLGCVAGVEETDTGSRCIRDVEEADEVV